jgi:hypothetical protein
VSASTPWMMGSQQNLPVTTACMFVPAMPGSTAHASMATALSPLDLKGAKDDHLQRPSLQERGCMLIATPGLHDQSCSR